MPIHYIDFEEEVNKRTKLEKVRQRIAAEANTSGYKDWAITGRGDLVFISISDKVVNISTEILRMEKEINYANNSPIYSA